MLLDLEFIRRGRGLLEARDLTEKIRYETTDVCECLCVLGGEGRELSCSFYSSVQQFCVSSPFAMIIFLFSDKS